MGKLHWIREGLIHGMRLKMAEDHYSTVCGAQVYEGELLGKPRVFHVP